MVGSLSACGWLRPGEESYNKSRSRSSKIFNLSDPLPSTDVSQCHMCYGPLKVSSEIALRKLNEQKDIFTIWENFVPGLFFQTAVSRERNEIL